jgi:hypothetical protein
MSQERLNGLVILSIEQDLLENIEYKSLISNFVTETVCRVIFFFFLKIKGLIFFCTIPGLVIPRTSPDFTFGAF